MKASLIIVVLTACAIDPVAVDAVEPDTDHLSGAAEFYA